MKNVTQWILIGLVAVVVILQIVMLNKVPAVSDGSDRPQAPSLDDIDQRIKHWTLHFGQHFSANSGISALESRMDKRLDDIQEQLKALAEK